MQRPSILIALAALAALAACSNEPASEQADESPSTEATPSPDAPVSIIRPDVEQPEQPEEALEPLEATVGFPDGGSELDAAAIAVLEEVLASPQVARGGAITLRAHSDAGGSGPVNARASQARGDAVKEWLVEKGIAESRIVVIAFGEQNPVEPNALPDGSPNEAGRAANRRVEIEVAVDGAGAATAAGSSGEDS
ncbi:OmpA family protein [Erythrobacter sp. THAF29]|uniref:OmpA family protein n=1 Tax=Erythrobacter sp. THAF29 TaxID=2587851 RepID=UPI0012A8039A|nr:OmpA family protein [Erythrobacter sp. THAF29]QFT76206.1 Photosystem I P700 chlorophyll a apoprotein A2 [Erythrobacter sp. THAF29]